MALKCAQDRSRDDLKTWQSLLDNTAADGELYKDTVHDFADECVLAGIHQLGNVEDTMVIEPLQIDPIEVGGATRFLSMNC